MPEEITLSLAQLQLDDINPRHKESRSQKALVGLMVEDQKTKLVELAKHILKHGLNPTDLLMVTPVDGRKRYLVLEGNRRIAALKLLESPELVPSEFPSIKRQFVRLNREWEQNPIDDIDCICFPDREAATTWIEIKHQGEGGGVGVVHWDAEQRRRYSINWQGKSHNITLQIIELLKEHADLSPEEKRLFDGEIPVTTFERVISNKEIKKRLGLTRKDGELFSSHEVDETARFLAVLLMPFVRKEAKVADVYDSQSAQSYFGSLGRDVFPDPQKKVSKSWSFSNIPQADGKRRSQKPHDKNSSKTSSWNSLDRQYVIPRSCSLTIDHQRIKDLAYELKQKIKVADCPNAASVMLRVFFESSIEEFLIRQGRSEKGTLDKKLKTALDILLKEKRITRSQRNSFIKTSEGAEVALVSTLHNWVHNRHARPLANEIKLTWDNLQLLFEAIWNRT